MSNPSKRHTTLGENRDLQLASHRLNDENDKIVTEKELFEALRINESVKRNAPTG